MPAKWTLWSGGLLDMEAMEVAKRITAESDFVSKLKGDNRLFTHV